MKIPYKYNVGQKVTLVNNDNFSAHWGRNEHLSSLIRKEVTVIERGFVLEVADGKYKIGYNKPNFLDKYNLLIYYYIQEDPYIEYNKQNSYNVNPQLTRINETCLSGEEITESFDEAFNTEDNVEIIPAETKVLEHIFNKFLDHDWNTVEEVNCHFTFSSYGTVVGLRKNYELYQDFKEWYNADHIKKLYEVETYREFLCFYEPLEKYGTPRPCGDARSYGYKHWTYIDDVWFKIPDNFVERYVNDALNNSFNKKIHFNPFNNWDVVQWLTELKIYDEVKKLFDEKKPESIINEEKKKEALLNFTEKAKKYLTGLTEEEKAQLKQML